MTSGSEGNGTLELAVVFPLEDPRGDVVDHLRTWTDAQTLSRDRYQIVVAANGQHPDFERRIAEELEPQDALVAATGVTEPAGAMVINLYDTAVRAADAPVLVLTEAHCRADPGCLEAVADAFAENEELDAATFEHRQEAPGDVAALSERWFERAHAAWRSRDWVRLNPGGVAVRAAAYERAGGLEPEKELFSPSFMSARFHQQGGHLEHLPDAGVVHVLEDTMEESLQHGSSFARGECVARGEQGAEFCDRYFGPGGFWDRRFSYRPETARAMVAALVSAIRRSPREAGWLTRELMTRMPARVAGSRPRWAWERGVAALQTFIADSGAFPTETRWRSYIGATERTVSAIKLRDGGRANGLPDPLTADQSLGAEHLEGVLIGVHSVERHEEAAFRWTEPVALLRLADPAGGATLRIRTDGVRGSPLDHLQGIYAGGEALPAELVTGEEGTLKAHLPVDFVRSADPGIVLVCRPFSPPGDRRRLGMPVVEVELSAP
jgi:hypothetical protein